MMALYGCRLYFQFFGSSKCKQYSLPSPRSRIHISSESPSKPETLETVNNKTFCGMKEYV
jgi:hypothetical protein